MKSSRTTWRIQHQCPQCGAPVTLREDDRLFSCAYCRVRLFLSGEKFFRYYIPPAEDIEEEIYYVPYWRFRGLYYSCPPFEVSGKILDESFLASGHDFFPKTLGFRPQTLTLRFVSPKVQGKFFPAQTPFSEVIPLAEKHSHRHDCGLISEVFHKAFIGETVSMIFAPVYLKNTSVYDAILKRPIAMFNSGVEEEFKSAEQPMNWSVKFLSTLCPECGWDTIGENESVTLVCGNCVSVWEVVSGSLKRVEFNISLSKEEELFYVPFRRVTASADGIDLSTYADFVRVANLPKIVSEEWEKQKMFFWLPAFKTNPNLFIRLAKLLTIAQPQIENDEAHIWVRRDSFAPITLGAREAAAGLKTTLAKASSAKKKLYPLLHNIELKARNACLVFLPFRQSGLDLIEANLNLRIPRSAFPLHQNSKKA